MDDTSVFTEHQYRLMNMSRKGRPSHVSKCHIAFFVGFTLIFLSVHTIERSALLNITGERCHSTFILCGFKAAEDFLMRGALRLRE